ncbi:glycosyltransferase [Chitinivorax sp. PXF-14]|uniref:glycosyltransferase n=1 Tax=Chitinivorax sp. PXF-14 TaxID=3230488 RepID=UPI00346694C0
MKREDIVLLSTADWDNPFWTNKQHVAVELARRGHKVLYIDSLGLRRPSASAQDLKRIFRRLKKSLRPPQAVRENIWVWSPLVIPFQRYGFIRSLNRVLLNGGLRLWMKWLGIKPQIFWTYNPMTPRLISDKGFTKSIYHCVDEIKAQPGMPTEEIEAAEHELVRGVDLCFVTAEHLLETRKALNPRTYYFSNVADYEHFAAARDSTTPLPADLAAIKGPRIGFIGAISGYKMDFKLVRAVAEMHPEWSLVLIGKVGEGDPWTDPSILEGLPNLHLIGPRDYDSLPAYLKGFDVAILPAALNEYTKSMFPMKFFEYLAAGKPVVSTRLHALQGYEHVAYLADDARDFAVGIEQALGGRTASVDERLDVAKEQTYEKRTERMMKLVAEHV